MSERVSGKTSVSQYPYIFIFIHYHASWLYGYSNGVNPLVGFCVNNQKFVIVAPAIYKEVFTVLKHLFCSMLCKIRMVIIHTYGSCNLKSQWVYYAYCFTVKVSYISFRIIYKMYVPR